MAPPPRAAPAAPARGRDASSCSQAFAGAQLQRPRLRDPRLARVTHGQLSLRAGDRRGFKASAVLVAPRRPVPGGRCMGSVAGLSGNEHLPEGQLPPFTRWVHATPAIEQPSSPQVAAASSAVLTEQQVLSWREAGFVCVDGLFAPEVVSAAVKESEETFPQPSPHESAVDLRERYSGRSASIGIGRPDIVFPYASPALTP